MIGPLNTLNNKKMKKEEQKKWTQAEADEALLEMELACEEDYQGEDRDALRATLRNADLSGLDLTNADLRLADLTNAVF